MLCFKQPFVEDIVRKNIVVANGMQCNLLVFANKSDKLVVYVWLSVAWF